MWTSAAPRHKNINKQTKKNLERVDALGREHVHQVAVPALPVLAAPKAVERAALGDDERVRVAARDGLDEHAAEKRDRLRHKDVVAVAVPEPPKVAPVFCFV